MSWEEDFLVSVAAVDSDEKKKSSTNTKSRNTGSTKKEHISSAASGCMVPTLLVIMGSILLGLVFAVM